MLILENIRLAITSLKANKMRALLTMLGIIIGIASVIAIMTIGDSLSAELNSSFASMGAANIDVMLSRKYSDDDTPGTFRNPTEDDLVTEAMILAFADKYKEQLDIISVTENVGSATTKEGRRYSNLTVSGVNYGSLKSANKKLIGGRYFNINEMNSASSVCIISDYTVKSMFDNKIDDALGSVLTVNIGDKIYPFTVVGVYQYEKPAYSFEMISEDDTTTEFYIPVRAAKRITHKNNYQSFTVVPAAGVDVTAFKDKVADFFNEYYENNPYFEIYTFSMSSVVEEAASSMKAVTLGISVIAGIALLVGGIGVMNIMLVSITERTREIGTCKALGAPNSSIRLQFIIESIVICLIGGVIGIILGVSIGVLGCKMVEVSNPVVSPSSIIISVGFSLAIGVFFGYYPANKAAKMDPIEALRYE